ncbi:hypothetical protein [Rhodoblastus sp.]|uniref:hypothetical protein n=1 Tax=Rhodoblastus sp. TaxID=1962975 RepID=UPI003F962353
MKRDRIPLTGLAALAALWTMVAGASGATFGELAGAREAPPPEPVMTPDMFGAQGAIPLPLDAPASAQVPPGGWTPPQAYLPNGPAGGLPNARLQTWTFGQVNSTTDPFNSAGLSTPYMFVPWSTPLSAWSNAQTWNWWRERAGVQPPYW